MYIILILLHKVQNQGKYLEIDWILLKIIMMKAIYWNTVEKYPSVSQYVFGVS